jgi:beta-galactosidase
MKFNFQRNIMLEMRRNGAVFLLYMGLALTLGYEQTAFAQKNIPVSTTVLPAGRQILFDAGWHFHRGGAQGAQNTMFDDSKWRVIDLPHDWSIEDLPGTDSPFARDAISQVSGGFTTGGTGWYRKEFFVPAELKGKRISLQFDGVYMNADVWVNGAEFDAPDGNHPYGYTPFSLDVTGKIHFGTTNVVAVKVRNEGENSRWYSGSGIYRHVWLNLLEPLHVAEDGVYITTPFVSVGSAKVRVQTRVINQAKVPTRASLRTRIVNAQGTEVARNQTLQDIAPGVSSEIVQDSEIKGPALWSLASPALYTNIAELYLNDQLTDRVETGFGIRSINFDATNGFVLNGEAIKLKGGCMHHDNGPLGAKAYDRAEARRVELMKASGFNAIRCAHNPPSPAFLDACDRLGMLVIDEAFDMWNDGKNPEDYHVDFKDWWQKDLERMIERDRNHPSIILWSIGNEIPNNEKPEVAATAKLLSEAIRKLDSTRYITSAVNGVKDDKDPYIAALDVAGYNYPGAGSRDRMGQYEIDHQRQPARVMVCTESYPLDAFSSWMGALDHPYVVGDFVWTGWDYIGEASIGWRGYPQESSFFPWNLAFCGDVDICGWRRPQSFYRNALWQKDQIAIFVKPTEPSFELNLRRADWSKWHFKDVVADWSWQGQEDQPLEINAYSSCEEVELFLNGKSFGRKPTNRSTQFIAAWQLPYQPGTLQAVGYDGGQKVGIAELRSAAAPSQIKLQADREILQANGEDLSYITVELLDEHGVCNPKAENLVNFEIEGSGTIVGVGNANPVSLESYQQPKRKAWHGRCLVIVKSGTRPGVATLKATSGGLTPSQTQLTIEPFDE